MFASYSAATGRIHDPARLDALQRSGLLDSPPEEAFDRLARLASRLLNAPVALVSLIDADRQFFKACLGLPEPWASWRQTPLSHSFCQHVAGSGEPLVIDDAREHPLVRDNLAIPDLGVVAYLGIPLITSDGQALGSFCVIDSQPRQWSPAEVGLLKDLTASVMTEVELRIVAAEMDRERREKLVLLDREQLARQQAEDSLRARDALLATVSHDLRNPLTAVKGYAQLIQHRAARGIEPDDAPRISEAAEKIRSAASRMTALIDELVDVTQLEMGQTLQLQLTSTDLVAVARRILADYEDQTSGHVLHLDASIPELLGHWDATRLERVLDNLVGNAVKYSPNGGDVAVEISGEDGWAVLKVRDQGVGIAQADLPHLFEPFFRGRNTRGQAGTGLGLWGVRQLIEYHRGRIAVESLEGAGTTVTVWLPLGAPAEA